MLEFVVVAKWTLIHTPDGVELGERILIADWPAYLEARKLQDKERLTAQPCEMEVAS